MFQKRVLEYEPVRPTPLPFWRRDVLLWGLICYVGYGWSIIGPVFVVRGVLSFFVDIHGMNMMGEPVQTTAQKIIWTVSSLCISALGIWFVAWHQSSRQSRRHKTDADGGR